MVVEEALVEAGFECLVANDGAGAMAILDAEQDQICAVITDIRMPGVLSGWDVGRRARELLPFLPVIYMTGDSSSEWQAHGVPGSILLAKPFVDAQLITAVSTLLNLAAARSLGT
jgi:CheY-like chemotaxis protein